MPHNWTDKIARKMQASKEVWGKLFGTIDTPREIPRQPAGTRAARMGALQGQRFAGMPQLPQRASMDITKQSPRASVAHQRFLFTGEKTCIDCHKGIAHHLPDMRGVPGWQ